NRDEQSQSFASIKSLLIAEIGDRHALDKFHDEVGATRGGTSPSSDRIGSLAITATFAGRAAVEYLGDIGVIHQREGLPLGLETGDDLPGVHAGFDDLEGHFAPDGLLLLGDVDHAHAAFADLFQQLVRADHRAGAFARFGVVR